MDVHAVRGPQFACLCAKVCVAETSCLINRVTLSSRITSNTVFTQSIQLNEIQNGGGVTKLIVKMKDFRL